MLVCRKGDHSLQDLKRCRKLGHAGLNVGGVVWPARMGYWFSALVGLMPASGAGVRVMDVVGSPMAFAQ